MATKRKRAKAPIRCTGGAQRFTVIRVNGDTFDTHAGRSFEKAIKAAQPDRGATVEVFRTCAADAGAARLNKGVLVRSFKYKGR
jgi:hypothetical protein